MAPVSLILAAVPGIALLSCTAAATAEPHHGTPQHTSPSPRQRSQEDLLRLHQDLQRQRLQRLEYRQMQQRREPRRPTPIDSWGTGR
jgi:Spy/CpxP family protein refolding chaperone